MTSRHPSLAAIGRVLAPVLVVVALAPAASFAAPTKAQVSKSARAAADRYTDSRYGIGGGAAAWTATCTRVAASYRCTVMLGGGECTGRVLVKASTARAYKVRDMVCNE